METVSLPKTYQPGYDVHLQHILGILKYIQAYVMLIVLSLGVLGNSISFVIFLRARKRANANVQYLCCLAVSDNGVICTLGLVNWLKEGLPQISNGLYYFDIIGISTSCKPMFAAMFVFQCISAWIIVAFSSERVFVVWFPLQRTRITTKGRSVVICSVCVASVLASIHRVVLGDTFDLNQGKGISVVACFYATESNVRIILWQLDTSLYIYVPCSLIFVANVAIIVGTFRSSKARSKIATSSGHVTGQETKMAISLIVISTLYIIFLLPATLLVTFLVEKLSLGNADQYQILLMNYFRKLLQNFHILNYCCNFIVYGCTLSFYRADAFRFVIFLFICCKRPGKSNGK
jgi:hypothetical protein